LTLGARGLPTPDGNHVNQGSPFHSVSFRIGHDQGVLHHDYIFRVPNAQDLTAGEFHFNGLKRSDREKLSQSLGIHGSILFK
jgi:hypothetical protein